MYLVRFYRTEHGRSPVEDYIEGLDKKTRTKVEGHLKLLAVEGPDLRRPYADVLDGPIRDLRIGFGGLEPRILYGFVRKDFVILLHAILKKTPAVPPGDIEKAEKRLGDLILRLLAVEVLE